MKHLTGSVRALSADGKTVHMFPDHEKLRASNKDVQIAAELLAKFFKMGDHVKAPHAARPPARPPAPPRRPPRRRRPAPPR